MIFEADMEIAGVHFVVTCRGAELVRNTPVAYDLFYGCKPADDQPFRVNVSAGTAELPHTEEIKKLFDTEQSWSIFKEKEQYYISLEPSAVFEKVGCHACFDENMLEATLYGRLLDPTADAGHRVYNPLCYPLDQILLMYILSKRKGGLIHAAGVSFGGRGYLFPGKSGAGKSTLSRQFLNCNNIEILSDDRIAARKLGDHFEIFGTPWPGELGIAENKNVPLFGIFFMHHADNNLIKEIKPREAMKRLMPVTSIPWYDEKVIPDILSFCEDMAFNVPAYELHFRPDKEVVDFIEEFVSTPAAV